MSFCLVAFLFFFTLIAAIPLAITLPAVLRYYAGEVKYINKFDKTKEQWVLS